MIARLLVRISCLALAGGFLLAGCSGDTKDDHQYREPITANDVVYNLKTSYITMDKEHYAELLADDFRFYFDPRTRLANKLAECWNRTDDSTATVMSLFTSERVAAIRLMLVYGAPETVNELGRETWLRVEGSAYLEVDIRPDLHNPEGLTLSVDNDRQTFYLRHGRNEADTLASSPTSRKLFFVEWRDQGGGLDKPDDQPSPVTRTTWSAIKTMGLTPSPYNPQITEQDVLENLQVAYRSRDAEGYSKLLADDFRFFFDPATRYQKNLPEFWTSAQDSTGTARSLLSNDMITDIRISLTYGTLAQPVTDTGHERWTRMISFADLEADQKPSESEMEGITYVVRNQAQYFYFRRGRNAADTLATSPTSNRMYLVEWRDQGVGQAASSLAPASQSGTWSNMKTLVR